MKTFFQNGCPKNTTLKWWPADTEERFNLHLKTQKSLLNRLRWNKESITYTFDQYGFRNSENINTSNVYNLVLGCSHTFGVGVNESDVWYNVLKRKFDEPFYNAAIAGGSIGGCYRSLTGLINNGLKVKRIFMLTPGRDRNEFFNTTEQKWQTAAHWSVLDKPILKLYLEENSLENFYQTNLLAIKHICKENNIELIDIPTDDDNQIDYAISKCCKARDLSHPGITTQLFLGKKFYEEYCKRYNR